MEWVPGMPNQLFTKRLKQPIEPGHSFSKIEWLNTEEQLNFEIILAISSLERLFFPKLIGLTTNVESSLGFSSVFT